MEDNTICKNLWAYSFRMDKHEENLINEVAWILQKCIKYLLREEEGTITKKQHLQGILWFESKLKTGEIIKYRNHFRREKGHISFISAKKIKSLSAYCNKTEGTLLTNLTDEEFALVPEWRNENEIWKDNLNKFLNTISTAYWEVGQQQEFVTAIIDFYMVHGKSPPTRTILYKQLLKYYEHYKYVNYISDINLFQNNY